MKIEVGKTYKFKIKEKTQHVLSIDGENPPVLTLVFSCQQTGGNLITERCTYPRNYFRDRGFLVGEKSFIFSGTVERYDKTTRNEYLIVVDKNIKFIEIVN
jgi:hypothetical protein